MHSHCQPPADRVDRTPHARFQRIRLSVQEHEETQRQRRQLINDITTLEKTKHHVTLTAFAKVLQAYEACKMAYDEIDGSNQHVGIKSRHLDTLKIKTQAVKNTLNKMTGIPPHQPETDLDAAITMVSDSLSKKSNWWTRPIDDALNVAIPTLYVTLQAFLKQLNTQSARYKEISDEQTRAYIERPKTPPSNRARSPYSDKQWRKALYDKRTDREVREYMAHPDQYPPIELLSHPSGDGLNLYHCSAAQQSGAQSAAASVKF
jgi:hypothetical protein